MSWSNDAAHPAQARVLRGPRVSTSRPASLLVDPEQLRLYQKPDNDAKSDFDTETSDEADGSDGQDVYVRDPEQEARDLEELALTMDRIREESFSDGYDKGLADGKLMANEEFEVYKQQVEQARDQEISSAAKALLDAVERVEDARVEAVSVAERDCVELAFKLTRALLNRELQLMENPVVESIHRALALAPTNEAVLIRLNPNDITVLSEFDMSALGRECTIIEDSSVEHGGSIVEVGPTTVDSQLSHALGRVRKALLGMGHGHHHDQIDVSESAQPKISTESKSTASQSEVPSGRPYLVGMDIPQ